MGCPADRRSNHDGLDLPLWTGEHLGAQVDGCGTGNGHRFSALYIYYLDNPFAGEVRLDPEALEVVLHRLEENQEQFFRVTPEVQ